MIPFFILFSAAGAWGRPWLFHALALLGGLMAPVAGGNAKAILLNTVATSSRGTVFGAPRQRLKTFCVPRTHVTPILYEEYRRFPAKIGVKQALGLYKGIIKAL